MHMAKGKRSTSKTGTTRPGRAAPAKANAEAVADSLLSLSSLLSLRHHDPALTGVIEGLGRKPRVQASDQLGFLSIKKAGVEFRFEKESWVAKDGGPLRGPWVLTEVGVYAAGHEGYKQYAGKLPKGITFESIREEVRKALGEPVESGGGNRFGALVFPEWDRFRVARKYFVDFSYLPESNRVCTVSITTPELADT
jgi:hypothetical protein